MTITQPQSIEAVDVTRLSCDALESKPVDVDWWSEGYAETWDFSQTAWCDGCGREILYGSDHREDCEADGFDALDLDAEGPMMNYYYPVEVESEDARKLSGPLCVVQFFDGRSGVALTGGGMDLSWEICEAFIELGYLPPVHFCRLPRMAGMKPTPRNLKIVEACRRSIEVERRWAESRTVDLDTVERWLEENTR